MAEQDVVERLRERTFSAAKEAVDVIESLRDDNASLAYRVGEQDALIASLRQELEAAPEMAARIVDNHAHYYASKHPDIAQHLREAAEAIRVQGQHRRALPRPDREGERE